MKNQVSAAEVTKKANHSISRLNEVIKRARRNGVLEGFTFHMPDPKIVVKIIEEPHVNSFGVKSSDHLRPYTMVYGHAFLDGVFVFASEKVKIYEEPIDQEARYSPTVKQITKQCWRKAKSKYTSMRNRISQIVDILNKEASKDEFFDRDEFTEVQKKMDAELVKPDLCETGHTYSTPVFFSVSTNGYLVRSFRPSNTLLTSEEDRIAYLNPVISKHTCRLCGKKIFQSL